jgi:hypothetical protein
MLNSLVASQVIMWLLVFPYKLMYSSKAVRLDGQLESVVTVMILGYVFLETIFFKSKAIRIRTVMNCVDGHAFPSANRWLRKVCQ